MIGRILHGDLSELTLPQPASRPIAIKVATDGTVWFTEEGGHALGRIKAELAEKELKTESLEEFPIASGGMGAGLVVMLDGTVWLQGNAPDQLLHFTGNAMEAVALHTRDTLQHRIISDRDGSLYFTQLAADRLGHLVLLEPSPLSLP